MLSPNLGERRGRKGYNRKTKEATCFLCSASWPAPRVRIEKASPLTAEATCASQWPERENVAPERRSPADSESLCYLDIFEESKNSLEGLSRKLSRFAITRTAGLLNMLYKPSELSEELDIPLHTIRGWAKIGMPHQRDSRGHLWINGVALDHWLQVARTQRPRIKLAKDEGFCLHCHRRVKLLDPVISYRTKPPLLSGTCPVCSGKVHRGVKRDPSA